jgi:hypothetical protein
MSEDELQVGRNQNIYPNHDVVLSAIIKRHSKDATIIIRNYQFLRILRDILIYRESGSANKNNFYSMIISLSDFIIRVAALDVFLHEIYAVFHSLRFLY